MMTPVSPAANRLPSLDNQASAPARKAGKSSAGAASAPSAADSSDFAGQVNAIVSLGQPAAVPPTTPLSPFTGGAGGDGSSSGESASGGESRGAEAGKAPATALKIATASSLVNPSGITAAGAAAQAQATTSAPANSVNAANAGASQSVRSVSTLEQLPQTQLGATQVKLGGQVASGQPWGSSWVFAGEGQPTLPPGMNPLIGGRGDAQSAQTLGENLMSQLDPELRARLSALQGGVESLSGESAIESEGFGGAMDAASAKGAAAKSSPMAGQLGGADFLSLIAAGRAPVAASPAQQGMGGGASDQGAFGRGQNGLTSADAIDGGKLKRLGDLDGDFAGASAAAGQAMARGTVGGNGGGLKIAKPIELSGQVTSGAMAQDRLSSESLGGLTSSIKSLGQNGMGEMRVRLKPDNLGELNLKVMTQGNQVSIQIQASDDRAKKIIEESLSHLRDSLSSQSLSLGRVDVAVASAQSQGAGGGSDFNQGSSQPQSQAFDLMNGQAQHNQGQNQGSRPGLWDDSSSGDFGRRPGVAAAPAANGAGNASAARRYSEAGNSRIDVRA